MVFVSLFCDENTNDAISTGEKKCVKTLGLYRHFFPQLKLRNSCFYHSTEQLSLELLKARTTIFV